MIWLILCVLSSAMIFVLFRSFPKWGAHTFPAIVVNYAVAATLGLFMLDDGYPLLEKTSETWVQGGLAIGVLFITLFYLMAFTSQRVGVGVTSVATKMSLVLPVAWFMLTDPEDQPTILKVSAVSLAIVGVVLTSRRKRKGEFNWSYALFPVIIFIGSGIIDLTLGHFSQGHLQSESDKYLFASTPFITAVVLGSGALVVRATQGKPIFNLPTLLGGALLGLVNFGSIYFIVLTFDARILDRSAIIPLNNLGTVLLSALAAGFLFRERFSRANLLGLALSIVAIGILLFTE
jgi:drug/metabolite transporter (DMT)-like permease